MDLHAMDDEARKEHARAVRASIVGKEVEDPDFKAYLEKCAFLGVEPSKDDVRELITIAEGKDKKVFSISRPDDAQIMRVMRKVGEVGAEGLTEGELGIYHYVLVDMPKFYEMVEKCRGVAGHLMKDFSVGDVLDKDGRAEDEKEVLARANQRVDDMESWMSDGEYARHISMLTNIRKEFSGDLLLAVDALDRLEQDIFTARAESRGIGTTPEDERSWVQNGGEEDDVYAMMPIIYELEMKGLINQQTSDMLQGDLWGVQGGMGVMNIDDLMRRIYESQVVQDHDGQQATVGDVVAGTRESIRELEEMVKVAKQLGKDAPEMQARLDNAKKGWAEWDGGGPRIREHGFGAKLAYLIDKVTTSKEEVAAKKQRLAEFEKEVAQAKSDGELLPILEEQLEFARNELAIMEQGHTMPGSQVQQMVVAMGRGKMVDGRLELVREQGEYDMEIVKQYAVMRNDQAVMTLDGVESKTFDDEQDKLLDAVAAGNIRDVVPGVLNIVGYEQEILRQRREQEQARAAKAAEAAKKIDTGASM